MSQLHHRALVPLPYIASTAFAPTFNVTRFRPRGLGLVLLLKAAPCRLSAGIHVRLLANATPRCSLLTSGYRLPARAPSLPPFSSVLRRSAR